MRKVIAHIVFAFCLVAASVSSALANSTMNPTELSGSVGGITTFWSLTKLGGGISVAISLVLAIGLFLIVYKGYELFMDKVRGQALLATNYRQLSVSEVNKLVMRSPNSLIARLYSVLLSIFHTTGTTGDFHEEIANYVQLQRDRFDTFRSRLAFLSDTAGALGLLGTVWGMFVTFFGGNLDSQRILNGMGLALVTTLIGLVVSIILNFCATEIFSVFNKRIELISTKADEFRLWLMAIVQQRQKRAASEGGTSGGSSGGPGGSVRPTSSSQVPSRNSGKAPAFSLRALSPCKQDGIIGQVLSTGPVSVAIEAENGQRVAGVPIRFQIVEGNGQLEGRLHSVDIKTDANGVASLNWTLGKLAGRQRLHVFAPDFAVLQVDFIAFAQPFIPNAKRLQNQAASSLSHSLLSQSRQVPKN